ncbi:hypothetical protein ABTX85_15690 [Streptomyces sp. NPDC096097]|uniref:hypothetical protein n=1 Tax=Streptomyces sp. NPDC096097 TaxID=3155546 RepID=UPI003333AEA7
MQYAFRTDASPADHASFGGRRAAQLASDSFLVWLGLPPSALSVNLNPDEPDRIIDKQFGRTDAGRVLLETVVLPASRRYFRLTSPHRQPAPPPAHPAAPVPVGHVDLSP